MKRISASGSVESTCEATLGVRDSTARPASRSHLLLRDVADHAIERAARLQRALTPAFRRWNDRNLTRAEFEQLGVEDYRRIFGHAVSTRHWRRLFRRTLNRDGGAQNWSRLELYLDETPALKRKPKLRIVPAAFQPLRELIASFENPVSPTVLEKDCLWVYAFEHFEREAEKTSKPRLVKRGTIQFLQEYAPFLGKSERGIRLQFERKLLRWVQGGRVPAAIADARKANPGRPTLQIPESEERALLAKALRSGGGIAQAWREARASGIVSAKVSQHYLANPASKSYVPHRIRKLLGTQLKMLKNQHHGPRRARLNGAYVNRDPSTFCSGDWFQADDCTLPNYYYTQSDEGYQVIRGQFLAMCDCRTTFILGFVLIPQRNYTAHHIRNLTTIVADTYGLPRKGFYYENGMWRTARLLHGRNDEINWHRTEMGLRGLGLQFRHAQLPRGKVIERVFGLLQNYLESEPGYAGRDERHHKYERVQEQLAQVRRGQEHPGAFFLPEAAYLQRLAVLVDKYNNERQEGKYCPGRSPKEAFEQYYGEEPRVRLDATSRHLLASHKMRVRCGRNGISFRLGKQQFTYKSFETGRLVGEELIAWFNVEDPGHLSVTNLKEDPRSLFSVEREIRVPGMDAPPDVLEAALAQNEAHEAYRKGLYRAVSQNFTSGFAGRMFRQNLIDRQTAEVGHAMRQRKEARKVEQAAKSKRAASLNRRAAQLGIAPEGLSDRAGAAEGLEQMTRAMRNLGLLKQEKSRS